MRTIFSAFMCFLVFSAQASAYEAPGQGDKSKSVQPEWVDSGAEAKVDQLNKAYGVTQPQADGVPRIAAVHPSPDRPVNRIPEITRSGEIPDCLFAASCTAPDKSAAEITLLKSLPRDTFRQILWLEKAASKKGQSNPALAAIQALYTLDTNGDDKFSLEDV